MKLILNKEELLDKYSRRKAVEEDIEQQVRKILNEVASSGDEALIEYAREFDGFKGDLSNLKVSEEEIDKAYREVDDGFLNSLRKAIQRVFDFHQKQLPRSWFTTEENGNILGQIYTPVEVAGIYVPGGTAAYPSSVVMNAVPAKVAGVKRIVMVSPQKGERMNPYVLVAAREAGVTEIYRVGGAHAIAALAFGTKTIPRVDVITGPGNIYVTIAKKLVYGTVNIDMLAGPSEVVVIADSSAKPEYLAADMLSQAEHDSLASGVVITWDGELARKTAQKVEEYLKLLPRREIILKALENCGGIVVVDDEEEALQLANQLAPEHLELMLPNPFGYLAKVKNAGAVFLGQFSPEPMGDYLAGPNHVLPTSGTSRFYSPLSVDNFLKKSSVIYYSQEGFLADARDVIKLAETEGLFAHALSVKVRISNE
ncbi:histidinol dehydrogenase [Carboxydothermus hydrogenoformans]|uniref:Histidinol dehydrogenase n=1 Tax=Carboxydothermus hydrogenoformans (strain ATCC BAA-161 / DSM 6008 / Z-2901) TaxID=246194 RepID=HISX_CARHZ|nr:histidinol dehydrogenase [Carboxydothermus hydrogenoformans]Q3AD53.1 RecName: Full=Histidinol dehydrogenase; Short=HDH [Carboxydothermus hydrogenoformans Z-2901]ABB15954.1 histidinol dehydrogenase [Carboxydothermus hydrogenoformans Z-2901]